MTPAQPGALYNQREEAPVVSYLRSVAASVAGECVVNVVTQRADFSGRHKCHPSEQKVRDLHFSRISRRTDHASDPRACGDAFSEFLTFVSPPQIIEAQDFRSPSASCAASAEFHYSEFVEILFLRRHRLSSPASRCTNQRIRRTFDPPPQEDTDASSPHVVP